MEQGRPPHGRGHLQLLPVRRWNQVVWVTGALRSGVLGDRKLFRYDFLTLSTLVAAAVPTHLASEMGDPQHSAPKRWSLTVETR